MTISYAPYHRWLKPVVPEPETLYGQKNERRLRSTLPRLAEHAITHELRPLDAEFLLWFTPLYETTIGSRQNAAVHDIYALTLGNTESVSEYWCLSLYEHGLPVGGTIIGIREDRVNIAYRVYPPKWGEGSLQAGPSLYTEFLVSKHAYELGKQYISHGKDRNPYGLNANIGLAIFKLSVGCTASILLDTADYVQNELSLDSLETDALILHFPSDGEQITEATLAINREVEEKYGQVLRYPHLLQVHVHYRN